MNNSSKLNKAEQLLIKELGSQIEQIEDLTGPEPHIYFFFDSSPHEDTSEDRLNNRESLRINTFNKIVTDSEKLKWKD